MRMELLTRVPMFKAGDVVRRHKKRRSFGYYKRPMAGEFTVLGSFMRNGHPVYHLSGPNGRTYESGEACLRIARKATEPAENQLVKATCFIHGGGSVTLGVNPDGSHYHFCATCASQ